MIRHFILLLLVCGVCSFAAYDLATILPDTVYVEDSNAVKAGNSYCSDDAQSCIIVTRGCREEHFALDEAVDASESEESLLARVYGSEPLQDSSKIYGQWASDCKKKEARERPIIWLHAFLAGGLCTAAGIGLFHIDYEHSATKVLGKGLGGVFLVTGIAFLSVDIVAPIVWLFKSPDERVQRYEEREKAWKLRIAPSINFSEPGGGFFLQLGF